MTRQQTFDTVVAHLRKQGARAMVALSDAGEMCVYRAFNGMKCAAGCLIPDDKYKPTFEKTRVVPDAAGFETEVTRVIKELGHDVGLVSALQAVHDAHSAHFWETRLAEVARDFNLVYSPITGGKA